MMTTMSRTAGRIRPGMLGFAAAAAVLAASLPAAAQETIDMSAPVDHVSDDVQRFCANIADAARDRRYALQKAELETLRAELDQRIALLEEKRAEYEEWLRRREEFLEEARDGLVDIYARMRPDAAAERLAAINYELAAGILMKIGSRKAGVILNEMETETAAILTSVIASAAREKDPS